MEKKSPSEDYRLYRLDARQQKKVEMVEEAIGSGGEKLFSFLTDFAGSSPPSSARPMLGGECT